MVYQRLSLLAGNALERYDRALYSLLAPFIAGLFFPQKSLLLALIILHLPVNAIFKPLGSFIFGVVADRYSNSVVMKISLVGVTLTSLGFILVPSYSYVGEFAGWAILILRSAMTFFQQGESFAAPILFLKQYPNEKEKNYVSSLYEVSGVIGTAISTVLVLILVAIGAVEEAWRLLYVIGFIAGIIFLVLRWNSSFDEVVSTKKEKTEPSLQSLPLVSAFFAVSLVTGFLHANYIFSTTVLNQYLPIVEKATYLEMLLMSLVLYVFDMLLLPLFGMLSSRVRSHDLITTCLTLYSLSLPILGLFFDQLSSFAIYGMRLWLILIGVAISASFQSWAIRLLRAEQKSSRFAMAKGVGACFVGYPVASVTLWLVKTFDSSSLMFYYLSIVALGSALMMMVAQKQATHVPQEAKNS